MIAVTTTRYDSRRQSTWALLALLVCIGVGVSVVVEPMAALGLVALLYFALRGEGVIRDGLLLIVAGNMILNYGFANIGISAGGLPLPFTDLVLVGLVLWCCFKSPPFRDIGLPAFFMIGILVFATIRLIVDFPVYHTLAVRDYTTSLETTSLIVGFFAFRAFGLPWANRFWLITCLGILFYSALFPARDAIMASSITVGLQQPVPLFGGYAGMGAAAGAAFLFFMLRVKPPLSLFLGAATLAALMLFQARGVYLGVPLALIIVVILGERLKTGIGSRLIGTLIIGGILLAIIIPFGPKGRMGPLSVSFVTQQMGTLFGEKGAGDGSYEDRVKWLKNVRAKQEADPMSLVWGLGLGPDLVGGASGGLELIRKPHNDYVEIFARFGFIGAVLWACFLGTLTWALWRGVRMPGRSRDERTFLLWTLASAILYMFISATQPQLSYAYGTLPLFVLFGMGLALIKNPPTAESDPDVNAESARLAPVFTKPAPPAPKPRYGVNTNVMHRPPWLK